MLVFKVCCSISIACLQHKNPYVINDIFTVQIRSLNNMCSAPLDLFTMLERQGSDFSDAMRKMNPPTHVATMKRGQSSTGRRGGGRDNHNAKKMYEEAQVKTF
jgi:hypothetical protein